MSEARQSTADAQSENVTLEYGDQFKHVITGDVRTIHDVREGEPKVLWVEGGYDYKDDLKAALRGEESLYEPHNRGSYWK
jgi:hypothetical protein